LKKATFHRFLKKVEKGYLLEISLKGWIKEFTSLKIHKKVLKVSNIISPYISGEMKTFFLP
jgi:hypothetical protein